MTPDDRRFDGQAACALILARARHDPLFGECLRRAQDDARRRTSEECYNRILSQMPEELRRQMDDEQRLFDIPPAARGLRPRKLVPREHDRSCGECRWAALPHYGAPFARCYHPEARRMKRQKLRPGTVACHLFEEPPSGGDNAEGA